MCISKIFRFKVKNNQKIGVHFQIMSKLKTVYRNKNFINKMDITKMIPQACMDLVENLHFLLHSIEKWK
jgi:hypothetical protein